MYEKSVSIERPFGMSVFGSALLCVSPDYVTIHAAINRTENKAADSLTAARKGSRAVAEFLRRAGASEFGMSRLTLVSIAQFVGGVQKHVGYRARIGVKIVLRDLDQCDSVVAGIVEAGANEITSTEFQSSQLKEHRARAREMAVAAAKEKAAIYAGATGVSLGRIVHVEDVNPQVLQGRGEGHVATLPPVDVEASMQTFDPGAIQIGAAVLLGYALDEKSGGH